MKKKILIVSIIFVLVILVFCCYKFFIPGNNKIVKDVNELDEYILNIKNYTLEAKVTVNSNKNTNTYFLKEFSEEGKQVQEIFSDVDSEGIVLEYYEERLIIKNTKLKLSRIFDDYENLLNNPMDFNSFIEDYKSDSKKEVREENNFYVISIRSKDLKNKYITNKTLYFNRTANKFERVEVKDINNNVRIIIEYNNFKLLQI